MIEPVVSRLTFRPLEAGDLRLLWRWLNVPHVRESYGLGRKPTLAAVEREYGPLAEGADRTRAYVIVMDGAPAGYLQAFRILDHPEYAREVGVADESYGLDLFLGDARKQDAESLLLARSRLWSRVREPIARTLKTLGPLTPEAVERLVSEAKQVAALCGLDWEKDFHSPAARAMPEPRAWRAA